MASSALEEIPKAMIHETWKILERREKNPNMISENRSQKYKSISGSILGKPLMRASRTFSTAFFYNFIEFTNRKSNNL